MHSGCECLLVSLKPTQREDGEGGGRTQREVGREEGGGRRRENEGNITNSS